jgi:hypothetical protein
MGGPEIAPHLLRAKGATPPSDSPGHALRRGPAKPGRASLIAGLGLAMLALAGAAPATPAAPPSTPSAELEAAHAAQVLAARRYRESLEALLPLQAAAVERAAAEAARRRALRAQGLIAAVDAEDAERALAGARATAERTRAAIDEAGALEVEAQAARELAALPPPAAGETQEGPTLIRHQGRARFSLAAIPALERFFAARFGHPLPVSARGQTPAHDQLGFDHRHALDVAVHPDSVEGRALLEHLRAEGIPFLAFRSARPGVATGAHVHIGDPSARIQRTSGGHP